MDKVGVFSKIEEQVKRDAPHTFSKLTQIKSPQSFLNEGLVMAIFIEDSAAKNKF
jgi:hypothetical protein